MIFPWLREKKLKMVWRTEREEKIGFLVGTAHFSPYRFRKSLLRRAEELGGITRVEPRTRRGAFVNGCRITFA